MTVTMPIENTRTVCIARSITSLLRGAIGASTTTTTVAPTLAVTSEFVMSEESLAALQVSASFVFSSL